MTIMMMTGEMSKKEISNGSVHCTRVPSPPPLPHTTTGLYIGGRVQYKYTIYINGHPITIFHDYYHIIVVFICT